MKIHMGSIFHLKLARSKARWNQAWDELHPWISGRVQRVLHEGATRFMRQNYAMMLGDYDGKSILGRGGKLSRRWCVTSRFVLT